MNKTNAEAKSESEAKSETKTQAESEAKLEANTSEAKSESKTQAESDAKLEANTSEAKSESKSADKETSNSWNLHGHLKTETKTNPEPKIKPTELDWLFNLIDSIQKGTFDPLKWPEFFNIPTPPQILLIEMLKSASQYAAVKVKMKEFEYEQQLKQSKNV